MEVDSDKRKNLRDLYCEREGFVPTRPNFIIASTSYQICIGKIAWPCDDSGKAIIISQKDSRGQVPKTLSKEFKFENIQKRLFNYTIEKNRKGFYGSLPYFNTSHTVRQRNHC